MVDFTVAGNIDMPCESEAQSKAGEFLVVQFVNHREQNFLGSLLIVFVVADEMRSHIVDKVVRIDVNQGAEQNPKVGYFNPFDFGAILPFTDILACNLPVYASQWLLPDITQDSVRGCWLGFATDAISGV